MFLLKDPKDQIIGVLHDVLQNPRASAGLLYALGYDDEVLDTLLSLMRLPEETGSKGYER